MVRDVFFNGGSADAIPGEDLRLLGTELFSFMAIHPCNKDTNTLPGTAFVKMQVLLPPV